jgi:hypothetical protein
MNIEVFLEQFRCPQYLHFDYRFHPKTHAPARNIADPAFIAKRKFNTPFIRYSKIVKKFKTEDGKRVIKPKERLITIPGHFDAMIYTYYKDVFSQAYEKRLLQSPRLQQSILAFRVFTPPQSHIHHAKRAFDFLNQHDKCMVMTFDVKSFFDQIDHKTLKYVLKSVLGCKELPNDVYRVLKSLTQYEYVKLSELEKLPEVQNRKNKKRYFSVHELRKMIKAGKIDVYKNEVKGLPQGVSASAVLSNVYMLDFDEKMSELMGEKGIYMRYCDDLFFAAPVVEEGEFRVMVEKIRTAVMAGLEELKLAVNADKTETTLCVRENEAGHAVYKYSSGHPDGTGTPCEGVQYLGLVFNGKDVMIRSSTLSRHYRKMKTAVRKAVYFLRKKDKKKQISRKEYGRFRRRLLRRYAIPKYADGRWRNFPHYADYCMKTLRFEGSVIKKQLGRCVKILDQTLAAAMEKHGVKLIP